MSIETETARDILLDAFDDIGVRRDAETIKASDERIGTKAINRIMSALDSNGVDLGFTKLEKISDPVTIPDGGMDALVKLLALRLWPKYRTPSPDADIIQNARDGETQMYQIGVEIAEMEYPSTLPIGSGNSEPGWNDTAFYSGGVVDTILAESNGSISLEDDTE